ncbi:MAG: magnesium chelatase subunit D [Rubrivivax sp.]|nr:magnesium chelatase subunit D [Rubrivivax sp.]
MPEAPNAGNAEDALAAVALLAVDPQGLGGVRVMAQAGPVRDAWLASLRTLLPAGTPVLRLPAGAGEDRLLGGIDLSATLAAGRPVLQPGLLAAAHGGVLLAAMAERLPAATAAHLAAALDSAQVRIERDGLSALHDAGFALVAFDEALPDDAPLSLALADRMGPWLDLSAIALADAPRADAALALDVRRARALLPQVAVGEDLLQALVAATLALGVDSARAAWLALRTTRASAALRGAVQADADDAALAARLVLAPRATRQPMPAEPERPDEPEDDAADAQAQEPPEPPRDDAADETRTGGELSERLVEAALASLPAGLLARLASGERVRTSARAAGSAGALSSSRLRGRPLGARRSAPHAGARLHLVETLRAAAPWQRLRRLQLEAAGAGGDAATLPRVLVRADDFHVRRFVQRRATTTVFAIDASGSSALHRLAEAKGAVELLLAQCYVRRDQVAVLAFRGRGAELLLPPTRSLVRAKRALAGLPGGGGTPLAAGIAAAGTLAAQVQRAGQTAVVVLLTDGRANVTLAGEGGRPQAQAEALAAARALRAAAAQVLLIDTSPRPEPAAQALALAAGARYLALPQADARALSGAVSRSLAAAPPLRRG